MPIGSSDFTNIARAVSAYSDEAYTEARKIISTSIVGSDSRINVNAEDYYGTIRWLKPLGALSYEVSGTPTDDTDGSTTKINIGDQSSTEGAKTGIKDQVSEYIKTVRTHGADEYQVQQILSGQSGLAKIGRDFGETQARDMDAAIVSVINGVATAEALLGTGGQTSPNTVVETNGFYVDLNDTTVQGFYSGSAGKLVDNAQTTAGEKISPLLAAAAVAWSDYEPDFMYLYTSPSEILDMKVANIVDDVRIQDGNVVFDTILSGKFRLVPTRTSFRNLSTATNVDTASVRTSFLVMPGSVALHSLPVPNPVAFDRDESISRGTGTTEAWYRWGYVMHPLGYTWGGSKTAFVANSGENTSSYDNTSATLASNFTRVNDMLNLGILPIFHA